MYGFTVVFNNPHCTVCEEVKREYELSKLLRNLNRKHPEKRQACRILWKKVKVSLWYFCIIIITFTSVLMKKYY